MYSRSLYSIQEFDASFQVVAEEAKILGNSETDQARVAHFLKNWEQLARQALLLSNLEGLGSLLNLLVEFSKLNPFGSLLLLINRYRGRMALLKGEVQSALEFFRNELAQAQANFSAFIIASLNLAEALQILGKIEQAEQHLQKALQVSYEQNLVFYQAQTLNRLTQLYLPQQRWERVQTSIDHAFYLLQGLKAQPITIGFELVLLELDEAFNRQLAGINYAADKRWDEAEIALLESLALSYRCRDKFGIAETQLKLGSVYFQMGRYTDALICLDDSQKICEQTGYLLGLVQTYYYSSLTYFAQKQYAKALSIAQRAIKVGVQIGAGVWPAWALYQLGQVYHHFNARQVALDFHLKAARMHHPEDQHPQWIELLIGLGDYILSRHDQTEHWEIALNCYREAVKLMGINHRVEHLAGVLGKMARAFVKLKGEQGLEEAINCYNLQLQLAGDLDSTILPQAVAVALRVEALTGIQCCKALRVNQSSWQLPSEYQPVTQSG